MVELHNGCICCTLRGDLLKTVRELSESDEAYDYLVIESTGIAEPLPVAQTFVMDVDDMSMSHDHAGHDHNGHDHGDGGADIKFTPLSRYAKGPFIYDIRNSFSRPSPLCV